MNYSVTCHILVTIYSETVVENKVVVVGGSCVTLSRFFKPLQLANSLFRLLCS